VALVNSTTDTLKKSRLRDRTEYRTRFSCLLQHWLGNGAVLFFYPRSPHKAINAEIENYWN